MPWRIHGKEIYPWSRKEREEYDTERHKIFKAEMYPHAHLPSDDFALVVAEFCTKHPSLVYGEGLKNKVKKSE